MPSVSGDSLFNLCRLIVFQTFHYSLISNIWILPNTWAVLLLIMWCHSWVVPVCKAFRASVCFRLWKRRLTVSRNLAENWASSNQAKMFFSLLSLKWCMCFLLLTNSHFVVVFHLTCLISLVQHNFFTPQCHDITLSVPIPELGKGVSVVALTVLHIWGSLWRIF